MKINFNLLFFLLSMITIVNSCKEFIEPSISNKTVQLQAPGNGYQSNKYSVNFWWDGVDDALGYRLQIVNPGFDSVATLILDTLVKSNKFMTTLEPGTYQWHVRAENGSSATAFCLPRNLSVIQSSLQLQTVTLNSPVDNFLTNKTAVNFQWRMLFGATKYRIEIDTNNFENDNVVVFDQSIPGQEIVFNLPKNQIYKWRVMALNDTEKSNWSKIYTISFDNIPPGQVSLTAPANNSQLPLNVNLIWSAVPGALKYKLYAFKSDSTTPFDDKFPTVLTSTSFTFNTGNSGDRVYWGVAAIDAAGNEGALGTLRSFILQ